MEILNDVLYAFGWVIAHGFRNPVEATGAIIVFAMAFWALVVWRY